MTSKELLRQAADRVEANPKVYFADVLNEHREGLVGFNASHALNLHLKFPRGTWYSWQDENPTKVVAALRKAAARYDELMVGET